MIDDEDEAHTPSLLFPRPCPAARVPLCTQLFRNRQSTPVDEVSLRCPRTSLIMRSFPLWYCAPASPNAGFLKSDSRGCACACACCRVEYPESLVESDGGSEAESLLSCGLDGGEGDDE